MAVNTIPRHPYDEGVWLGDIGALRSLPEGVDAVVSLCRVGNADLPARAEQIDVRLIDRPGGNINLDFVLLDTVRTVEQLRRDGRTVLIHCVQAQSRTPAVAGSTPRGCAASASPRHWLMYVPYCRTPARWRSFARRCDDFIPTAVKQ